MKKTRPVPLESLLERLAPAESDLDRSLYAMIGRVGRGDYSITKKTVVVTAPPSAPPSPAGADALASAVLALVTSRPALVSDICYKLRRFGRVVTESDVLAIVQDHGGYVRSRPHGSGVAIYVATIPFSEVTNGRGKVVPVS